MSVPRYRIVQRVAELPDRTSPDDWPDAMLVTADELSQIISEEWAEVEREIAALREQRDKLRAALAALVGASEREELEQLEAMMRLMHAPAADKAASIDAIHALIATADVPHD